MRRNTRGWTYLGAREAFLALRGPSCRLQAQLPSTPWDGGHSPYSRDGMAADGGPPEGTDFCVTELCWW